MTHFKSIHNPVQRLLCTKNILVMENNTLKVSTFALWSWLINYSFNYYVSLYSINSYAFNAIHIFCPH